MVFCSLLLLALLLFFPNIAIDGSRYGASLWLTELLPTLLPYFIAVRLFQYCLPHAANKRIFLFTGLLCGYPVGASLVARQYSQNLLSKKSAYFYLGLVNNPSPMFIMAYCGNRVLGLSQTQSAVLFILLLISSLVGSLMFRALYSFVSQRFLKSTTAQKTLSTISRVTPSPAKEQSKYASASEVLDSIIIDSFRVMLTVGGYVILFSILGQLFHTISCGNFSCGNFSCGNLSSGNSIVSLLGSGLLEISSGASYLKAATLSPLYKRALMLAILSFGGLSAAFQTSSIITRAELSLIPYLINKALNGLIAGMIALLVFRIL